MGSPLRSVMIAAFFLVVAIGTSAHPRVDRDLPAMVYIPATEFDMGVALPGGPMELSGSSSLRPHRVSLHEFHISRHEVTFAEFIAFVEATGFETRSSRYSPLDDYWSLFSEVLTHPVVSVSYEEAMAYCRWLTEITGDVYRLPTEAEWELAATGGLPRHYPWGFEYRPLVDQAGSETTSSVADRFHPVDEVTDDVSPLGVYGLYGNVAELVLDYWTPFFYDYSPTTNPLNLVPFGTDEVVVRGRDTYTRSEDALGVRARRWTGATYGDSSIGFRVVREPNPTVFNQDSTNPIVFDERLLSFEPPRPIRLFSGRGEEFSSTLRTARQINLRYWPDSPSSAPLWVFGVTDTDEVGWVVVDEKMVEEMHSTTNLKPNGVIRIFE